MMDDAFRSLIEAAHKAFADGEYEAAVGIGFRMIALDPHDTNGPFHASRALRHLNRADEAEELLRNAPERWPDNESVLSIWVTLPMQHRAWDATLERCEMLIARMPHEAKFVVIKLRTLIMAGRLGEVSPLLKAALLAFPQSSDLGDVQREMERVIAIAASAAGVSESTIEAANALMMKFESLGGDYPGCEIGLVQRHYSADPLGLLRWTTTPPNGLIEALKCRFSGVGDDVQTELKAMPSGDYKALDTKFGMDMVTFLKMAEVDADAAHRQATRRMRFLRDKLIGDLTAGEKIFVYRCLRDDLPMLRIQAIKDAMSDYGNNVLLYLRLAGDTHRPGDVEWVSDGLMIGYVAKFSDGPAKELFLEGWLEVFQAAARADDAAEIGTLKHHVECRHADSRDKVVGGS